LKFQGLNDFYRKVSKKKIGWEFELPLFGIWATAIRKLKKNAAPEDFQRPWKNW
jgi:hypothetical protein